MFVAIFVAIPPSSIWFIVKIILTRAASTFLILHIKVSSEYTSSEMYHSMMCKSTKCEWKKGTEFACKSNVNFPCEMKMKTGISNIIRFIRIAVSVSLILSIKYKMYTYSMKMNNAMYNFHLLWYCMCVVKFYKMIARKRERVNILSLHTCGLRCNWMN